MLDIVTMGIDNPTSKESYMLLIPSSYPSFIIKQFSQLFNTSGREVAILYSDYYQEPTLSVTDEGLLTNKELRGENLWRFLSGTAIEKAAEE